MSQVEGLRELTLEQIARMDGGRIGTAMDLALKRVAEDMDDRPGEDRPRKVVLEIACIPVVSESGLIEGAKLQMQVKDTIPTRKSMVYDVGVRKGGMMVFQDMSLENHRQNALPFNRDDEEENY